MQTAFYMNKLDIHDTQTTFSSAMTIRETKWLLNSVHLASGEFVPEGGRGKLFDRQFTNHI